jgi:hypothetical protein
MEYGSNILEDLASSIVTPEDHDLNLYRHEFLRSRNKENLHIFVRGFSN